MALKDEKKPRKRTLLLYGLYSAVLVLILLYIRFPSGAVRDYVEGEFRSLLAPLELRVGSVDPDFPPGLVFEDLRLSRRETPDKTVFAATDLKVRPEVGKLFRGIPAARIHLSALGGSASVLVSFSDRRLTGDIALDLELKGIRLEENRLLQDFLGRRVQGIVEGTVNFAGRPVDLWTGEAEVRLVARDGDVEIMQPLLGRDNMEFSKVLLIGGLKGGRFRLNTGDIEGPDYRGSLTGWVFPEANLSASRLDLQGWIELFPSFFARKGSPNTLNFIRQRLNRGKLNFSILGTAAKPVLNLT
jgi:type II secretion system protein N